MKQDDLLAEMPALPHEARRFPDGENSTQYTQKPWDNFGAFLFDRERNDSNPY